MRGMSLFLMLLAMAMFMVGCDNTSQPLPSGAPDATSDVDVDYEPPPEEQEGQPVTEPATEPMPEDPAVEAPAEPAVEAPATTDTP
jgi:PBP1b-binding outer membrane lipoprotein LpoB